MLAEGWLRSRDPVQMLEEYRSKCGPAVSQASQRKYALLGCGCCRLVWDGLADPRCRKAVETAELFADGDADPDLVKAMQDAAKFVKRVDSTSPRQKAAFELILNSWWLNPPTHLLNDLGALPTAVADIVRCVLGNPFRPLAYDPSWRTSTVVALAEGIYADRAFDRMPILADAIEEAGCNDADVLGHARAAAPHARGCWVVDWVLRKG